MDKSEGFRVGRLIFPALLAWVAGTAAQLQQVELFPRVAYLAMVAVACVSVLTTLLQRMPPRWKIVSVAVSCGVLAFAATGLRAGWFLGGALDSSLEGRDLRITGVVAAMPQRNEDGLRFRFDVESATLAGLEIKLPPRIYLSWYNGPLNSFSRMADGSPEAFELQRHSADLGAAERWQLTARLKSPHGGSNPHGFDFELWLWEQGLQATGYVRAGPKDAAPQRLARTWSHPVERARQHVRDRIVEQVKDKKAAGVIAALVVGDQNAIDRADWDVFRAAGVAHLMSISGLHVTMFAWAAMVLLRGLWRRSERLCFALPAPSAGLIGGVLLATAYALFSGWGVPSQRTVLMLAAVGLLRLGVRRWPWPHVWLLACAVVVLADPWALMQAGFWLSFVAVGVLFATDSAQPSPPNQSNLDGVGQMHTSLLEKLVGLFKEQWVVTLALTPLTLLLFGQVSVVGLFANLLAIPWVTLVVTPLAMLGVVFSPVWILAALSMQALGGFLSALVSVPFATVSIAQAPLWAGAVGVVGGMLMAIRLPWQMRLLGLPMMLPVLLWQAARPTAGEFELLAADIGQGNAVIVRTATHALLYDSGPRFSRESDAGHRVLVPLLRALDVKLDTLVLSHRDADHTGGAVAVLTMHPSANLLSSIELEHGIQAVRKATRCEAGQRWHWDGVDFEILHPGPAHYERNAKSNALSCVLKISNTRQSALLAGDIEKEEEASLAASGVNLKATVLLVPHHGSKTSSSAVFLDAVQPKIGLVQIGYRNRFGHPAAPVLERYQERNITLFDSPHCGAATWRSDQAGQVQCDRFVRQRYWSHRAP